MFTKIPQERINKLIKISNELTDLNKKPPFAVRQFDIGEWGSLQLRTKLLLSEELDREESQFIVNYINGK